MVKTGLEAIDSVTNYLKEKDVLMIGSSMPINVRPLIYKITKNVCEKGKRVLLVNTMSNKSYIRAYINLKSEYSKNLTIISKDNVRKGNYINTMDIYDYFPNGPYDLVVLDNVAMIENPRDRRSYFVYKMMAIAADAPVIGVTLYDKCIRDNLDVNSINNGYFIEASQYVDYALLLKDVDYYDTFETKELINVDAKMLNVRKGVSKGASLSYKLNDKKDLKLLLKNAKALGLNEEDALTFAINWSDDLHEIS